MSQHDSIGLENAMVLPQFTEQVFTCQRCGEPRDLMRLEVPAVIGGLLVKEICAPCWQVCHCKECRETLAAPGWDLCIPCSNKMEAE